jgi:putative sterol carrier protein
MAISPPHEGASTLPFSDAEEVRRYIGGIFTTAFAEPDLKAKLASTGAVVRFEFTEPEVELVVDMVQGTVGYGLDQPDPTATMHMTADLSNEYWQGKVNLLFAMARGKIKIDGNVASLLKLAPLGKRLFPTYVSTLERDGRQDLLV